MTSEYAPGRPGIPPKWCSSDKDLVVTSLGSSRVWATIGRGILNEIYWPSTGRPQTRDLGFIVAKDDHWQEVKRDANYEVLLPQSFLLLPSIRHQGEGFELDLQVVCDDLRDVILIRYELKGDGYRLYALLSPRLGDADSPNSGWQDGRSLYARSGSSSLCLECDTGFDRLSAGYVGVSDGWSDFCEHGRMTWTYARADDGNVALFGELTSASGVLALGFANSPLGARTLARSSLAEGFPAICHRVEAGWQRWRDEWRPPAPLDERWQPQIEHCAAVLKTCEDRLYPGAVVASLSVPWGQTRSGVCGYHFVWPRDAVESAFGMLAVGHYQEARHSAAYLIATQQQDGGWSQNSWPDGAPHWTGVQLDEIAFPVLLVAKLDELGELGDLHGVQCMVARALGRLVRAGPVSEQDRWENASGISAFTLALQIAALAGGAPLIEDEATRQYLLSYADYLYDRIDDWLYATQTDLANRYNVDGYYIRLAKQTIFAGDYGTISSVRGEPRPADMLVSLGFGYLIRLGLRRADDARCLNTLKVVDGELKVDAPTGPSLLRYQGDAYGEHEDGSPFDGDGRGRLWPLLTGERGHLAVDLKEDAAVYLDAMTQMTGTGGLLPEQVWDDEAIPQANLFPGKPTGSAMPLLWAHAELLKLAATIATDWPIERLRSVYQRYAAEDVWSAAWHWRSSLPFQQLPAGKNLMIEAPHEFVMHLGWNGWQQIEDRRSESRPLGMHGVWFAWEELAERERLDFTLRNLHDGTWEQVDHSIAIEADADRKVHDVPNTRRAALAGGGLV